MAASRRKKPLLLDLSLLRPGFYRRRPARGGVGFEAFVWRGGPGPVLLVNGATHGDEYEGPTLLRRWVARWRPARLAGTVVFVPVLNEGAFFAGQRCDPADGRNLARSFPGRRRGSPTQRLAALFDGELLAQATHYIDFHSAGAAYELDPWAGYIAGVGGRVERLQRAMTACFDRFWCWAGGYLPGRTLSAAHARGIPAMYVECRGCGGVEPADLRGLDRGLRAVLRLLGMVPGRPGPLRRQRSRVTTGAAETHLQIHHPAPHDGLFVPTARLGGRIRRGRRIGLVYPLDGGDPTPVPAVRSARVVMIRRQRSVRRGDALAALAGV
jgi:predicted deacylase